MLLVVFLMLSLAAVFDVVAHDRRAGHRQLEARGRRGPFRLEPFQDLVDRDSRLLGEVGPFNRDDRQHRLIAAIGARADQPRTDHRRAVRVELLDPQLGMRLGELVKAWRPRRST